MVNLNGARDHEENDYSVLMDEGLNRNELVRKLCQSNKEVIWAIEMNNQNLNFNVGTLHPK